MKNEYVNKEELLEEIIKFKKTCKYEEYITASGEVKQKYIQGSGVVTDRFGEMIYLISKNLARRPNFSGYTWKNDFINEGVLTTIKYVHNFNPDDEKANCFAYITTICYYAFVNYIRKQNKHKVIKDACYNNSYRISESFIDRDNDIDEYIYVDKGIDYELARPAKK